MYVHMYILYQELDKINIYPDVNLKLLITVIYKKHFFILEQLKNLYGFWNKD